MTNKEQQIVDAITKQLARIAPEVDFVVDGTTYTATELIKTVAPERTTPYEADDLPALFIATGDTTLSRRIMGIETHEMEVKILVFTNEADGLRVLRLAMADVVAAMAEGATFGGLLDQHNQFLGRSMGGTDRDPVPSLTYRVSYQTQRGQM